MVAAVLCQKVGEDIGRIIGVSELGILVTDNLEHAISNSAPEIMVDFTNPKIVMGGLKTAINAGYIVWWVPQVSEADLDMLRSMSKSPESES